MKKTLIAVVSTVLVCCCVFGGTLAYLTAKTEKITNTFTVGDVAITLTETTGTEYKMIPGHVYSKNPKVAVTAGSEACWLFVKVDETNNPKNYLTYSIDSKWKPVSGATGVYYISVDATNATNGVTYSVLTGNTVTVISTLTQAQLSAAKSDVPAIAFTAYAVQADGFNSAEDAWVEAAKLG